MASKSRLYEYACESRSLLAPVFESYVVTPCARCVPYTIPANAITLFALGVNLGSVSVVASPYLTESAKLVCFGIFTLAYTIIDHVDGMHARRTDTCSALGDFMDHFADAVSFPLIAGCVLTVLQVHTTIVWSSTFVALALHHGAVVYEHLRTRRVIWDPVSSLEYLLLISVFMVACAIPSVRDAMGTRIVLVGLTVADCLFLSLALAIAIGAVPAVIRARRYSMQFILHLCGVIVIGVLGSSMFPPLHLALLLSTYSICYIGSVIHRRLVDDTRQTADILVPILIVFTELLPLERVLLFVIAVSYLSCRIALNTLFTFYALRSSWRWVNHKRNVQS